MARNVLIRKRLIKEKLADKFRAGFKLALIGALLLACLSGCKAKEDKEVSEAKAGFEPRLDTEKEVAIEIAGFLGNFEALDQVVNSFNEYYPNVSISYEQNNGAYLSEYMNNNKYTDILMTSDRNVRNKADSQSYIYDYCLDLSKEDIDLGDIKEEMLEGCTVDGRLVRLPLAESIYGIMVNKSLLEKEGLKMPENYGEFKQCLEKLKAKGYTPIQGAENHVYSELMVNMAMATVCSDKANLEGLNKGDKAVADSLLPVYERLEEIIKGGYTDYEINKQYPEDNYDKAILRFFDGEVPFWVCSSECVSGMKKRETKSESFTKNPFEYEFIYPPMGEKGAFEYIEPWYGFSVNKDSDVKDYAVEFMRFLATREEINTMASVKGMPSVAKEYFDDEKYRYALDRQSIEKSYINNGALAYNVLTSFANSCNGYGAGKFKSPQEALDFFIDNCKE